MKMKSDAAGAGAGGFSFEGASKSEKDASEQQVSDEDLYQNEGDEKEVQLSRMGGYGRQW